MRYIFLLLTSFSIFSASAQVKISQMPTYSGNITDAWLPIIANGINYKLNAGSLQLDSNILNSRQKIADTNTLDATRYWTDQNFYPLTNPAGFISQNIATHDLTLTGSRILDADDNYFILKNAGSIDILSKNTLGYVRIGAVDSIDYSLMLNGIEMIGDRMHLNSPNIHIEANTGIPQNDKFYTHDSAGKLILATPPNSGGTLTNFTTTDSVVGLDLSVTNPTTIPNLNVKIEDGYTIPTITQLADYVDKTTNQTIGGNKTFSNAITVSDAIYIGMGAGNVSSNIAIGGNYALSSNTTGGGNIAVGGGSLRINTTGVSNVAVGHQSLYSNTTGGSNVAIGQQTLWSNTTGGSNVAVGFRPLYNNTTGASNVAVGRESLYYNTTGANNVAVGNQSLYSNTTGSNNVAFGYQSLYSNSSANNNIAIGSSSQKNTTTGDKNVAIGGSSMQNNTVGTNTIAIGANTLQYNTTGNYNVALGSTALQNNTTGSYNIAIGYNAGSPNTDSTVSNKLYIGNKTSTNAAISQHIIVGDLSTKILTFNGYNSTGDRTLGVTSDGTLRLAGEAGQYTGAGGSSTATFTFNHNMGTTPTHVSISPMNAATVGAGLWYWSATSTTVTITFATAITASNCAFSYNILK